MSGATIAHLRAALLLRVTLGCLLGSVILDGVQLWAWLDGAPALASVAVWSAGVVGLGTAATLAVRGASEGATRALLASELFIIVGAPLLDPLPLANVVLQLGPPLTILTAVALLDGRRELVTLGMPVLYVVLTVGRAVGTGGPLGTDLVGMAIGGGTALLLIGEIARRGADALLAALQASDDDRAALRVARDQALAASSAKSRFLANMSHELRTPLNAILGYTELLLDDVADPGSAHELRAIHRAGGHLLAVIDDLLDLAKVEAGQLQLEVSEVDFADLVYGVVDQVLPLIADRPVRLVVQGGGGRAWVDRTRVRQVLLNLVGNALKFTSVGEIRVVAGGDRDRVWLEVVDTGPGMSPELAARAFEPFVQGVSRHGGVGLGLAITRDLVDLMGGVIDLESAEGRGTRVCVRLPRDSRSLEGRRPRRVPPVSAGEVAEC
jgi:signal transduction histidine kinase